MSRIQRGKFQKHQNWFGLSFVKLIAGPLLGASSEEPGALLSMPGLFPALLSFFAPKSTCGKPQNNIKILGLRSENPNYHFGFSVTILRLVLINTLQKFEYFILKFEYSPSIYINIYNINSQYILILPPPIYQIKAL